MTISLYDISVANYLQLLGSMNRILDKGAAFAADNGVDLDTIVATRLRPDMLDFRFQLSSVFHHSLGAINGIREGVFGPPPSFPDLDYAGLQALLGDAASQLQLATREDIDAMEGKAMVFKLNALEIPFTAENFVLSFSLPNVYFHATTAYDILRIAGVPLGKRDFLGDMRIGV